MIRDLSGRRARTHAAALAVPLAVFGTAGAQPASSGIANPLPKIVVGDGQFETRSGERVSLRGVNLGNWLLIEPWMFGIFEEAIDDQHEFITVLTERFGRTDTQALLEAHRASWITEPDLERIASVGLNMIRLPIHYSVIEDPDQPGQLNAEGIHLIDRCFDWAETHGLYVVLDMHGAPGGQSDDAPTGRRHQNKLWENEENLDRLVNLWRALADRYAKRRSLAMYDLLNEPYGDFSMNVEDDLVALVGRLHDTIREVDPLTPLLAPATERGFRFYGDPKDRGWSGVAFTEHYYPGVFGGEPRTMDFHRGFVAGPLSARASYTQSMGVPLLAGEFNVVFDALDAPRLNTGYIELFDDLGWASTLWSYRLHKSEPGVLRDNWYIATNAAPAPLDIRTMAYGQILEMLTVAATGETVLDPDFEASISPHTALPFEISEPDTPTGRQTQTVGAQAEAWIDDSGQRLKLTAAGADIWGRHDTFGWYDLTEPAQDSGLCTIVIESFESAKTWGKLGLMLREDLDSDSRMAMVHVFENGEVLLLERSTKGGVGEQHSLGSALFPVTITASDLGSDHPKASISWPGGQVREIGLGTWDDTPLVGIAMSSNDAFAFAQALIQVQTD
ncbi:MAG: cellulase family glycosylhydrolase [Planctomycetota bacterium]